MAFLRVMGLVLAALVVLYLVLSLRLRLGERQRLAEEWETGPMTGDREGHVREGMATYDRSLRNRLLWLVIVLPMAALLLLLYLLNTT